MKINWHTKSLDEIYASLGFPKDLTTQSKYGDND